MEKEFYIKSEKYNGVLNSSRATVMLLMTTKNAKKIYTKFIKREQVPRMRKDISKLPIISKDEDIKKVWNYILPEQKKSTRYSPIQSIPALTKQTTINRLKKNIKT